MKRAIFFDLDGTLWDALEPLTDIWNKAMEDANEPYRFDLIKMKSYMGLTPEETCPLAFPGTSLEEGMRLFKICLDAEILYLSSHPGKMYPHEEEVLDELSKRYPLYVVSNADKGYIQNYLNGCNMKKYFKDFVQAGDTGFPKWKNILYMKDKEGIDEVIYVGDTLKDKNETMKANQKFIHAAYGFGEIPNEVNKINSLDELIDLVEKLFNEKR